MKAKPIEPGCLAICTNHKYAGRIFRCISLINDDIFYDPRDGHAVPIPLNAGYWHVDGHNWSLPLSVFPICKEKDLIRIDDPDIQSEIESERELEISK